MSILPDVSTCSAARIDGAQHVCPLDHVAMKEIKNQYQL
jgi:hypothetical protein